MCTIVTTNDPNYQNIEYIKIYMYQLRNENLLNHSVGFESKGRCLSVGVISGSKKFRKNNGDYKNSII